MIGSIWSLPTSCRSEMLMRTSESYRHRKPSERRKGYLLGLATRAQAVQASDAHPAPVTIAEPARRVLPDLLAAAREEERVSIRLRKTKRPATRTPITQRRANPAHQPVTPPSVPAQVEPKAAPVEVPSRHAAAAIVLSRRNPGRSKLPAGQR